MWVDVHFHGHDTFLGGQIANKIFFFFLQNKEELFWGPEACPCVHSIQSPSLLPVNVERKITLVGKNFHHYQVTFL